MKKESQKNEWCKKDKQTNCNQTSRMYWLMHFIQILSSFKDMLCLKFLSLKNRIEEEMEGYDDGTTWKYRLTHFWLVTGFFEAMFHLIVLSVVTMLVLWLLKTYVPVFKGLDLS